MFCNVNIVFRIYLFKSNLTMSFIYTFGLSWLVSYIMQICPTTFALVAMICWLIFFSIRESFLYCNLGRKL